MLWAGPRSRRRQSAAHHVPGSAHSIVPPIAVGDGIGWVLFLFLSQLAEFLGHTRMPLKLGTQVLQEGGGGTQEIRETHWPPLESAKVLENTITAVTGDSTGRQATYTLTTTSLCGVQIFSILGDPPLWNDVSSKPQGAQTLAKSTTRPLKTRTGATTFDRLRFGKTHLPPLAQIIAQRKKTIFGFNQ